MPGTEAVTVIFVVATVFGSAVVLIRSLLQYLQRSRTEKALLDLHSKVLDRFGNAPEFITYLQSEAGQNLLRPVQAASERPGSPYTRVMNGVQYGVATAAIGIGLLIMRGVWGFAEAQEPLAVIGSLGIIVGVALLLSAGSSWTLARKWGLINGNETEARA
jgi:hypothetical protein